jgi:hypothetical protein
MTRPILWLAASCLLVPAAACGPRPASTQPIGHVGAPATVPAPHYAGLFQAGATWHYEVVSESVLWDDEDPAADADGTVRTTTTEQIACTVEEVVAFAGGVASHVGCEAAGQDVPIQGAWAADARGLYRIVELPAGAAPVLDDDALVLAAQPMEHNEELTDPEHGEVIGARSVTRQDDGWCTLASWVGGDESWHGLCLGADGVITSAEAGWAGGSEHTVRITLLR